MFLSPLLALVAALSVVGVNGAVIERDGTFTYLSPQPTAGTSASSTTTTGSPSTTSTRSSVSTTSTSVPIMSTTPTTSSTTTSVTGVSPCSQCSTTSTTKTSTTSTITSSSTTGVTPPCPQCSTTSTTMSTTSSSATVVVSSCPPCSPTTTTSTTPCVVCSATPTTTTSTTTSAPSGTANCNGVQQWQASFAYSAADRVIFNGQLFTAKQWTYNNSPPSHPDQWTNGGTCAQPINNQANCNGVAAWQSTVAYTAGNQVTFNSHLWSAVQWTQSNPPGDTSGSWKDKGACA